ncbi:MAG: hypothetical protein IK079_00340 [Desulfovibrio sp.]|nr:hypothetical protein [Desulfovibrio sp.]
MENQAEGWSRSQQKCQPQLDKDVALFLRDISIIPNGTNFAYIIVGQQLGQIMGQQTFFARGKLENTPFSAKKSQYSALFLEFRPLENCIGMKDPTSL